MIWKTTLSFNNQKCLVTFNPEQPLHRWATEHTLHGHQPADQFISFRFLSSDRVSADQTIIGTRVPMERRVCEVKQHSATKTVLCLTAKRCLVWGQSGRVKCGGVVTYTSQPGLGGPPGYARLHYSLCSILFCQFGHGQHFTNSSSQTRIRSRRDLFIYLFIYWRLIDQSTAQGHLRAFHKFKSRNSWIQYKTCTLHTNIIRKLVPSVSLL